MRDRGYWLLLLGMAGLYLVLAALLPPLDDELYYWCWAQNLQLSYFDHPPLSALFIRLSTTVFGNSVLATRLPACVSTLIVVGILGRLMQPRNLWPWVIATPLFTYGAVLITPDTPLLVFWAIYLVWLIAVHRRLTPENPALEVGYIPTWLWLIGGVILGCGALGKYTMALTVPASFVSFLLTGVSWKKWLPGYIGHGVVSFVLFLPVLVFNYQHDFAPIRFQWEHAMDSSNAGLKTFGEFVGIQLVLFGLLPFTLLPWVVMNVRTLAADPRLRVCLCLYAIPFTFFLYKSCRGPLEGNWALASYIGFWPLAAHWFATVCLPRFYRVSLAIGFGLPLVLLLIVTTHLIVPIPFMQPSKDRISRQPVRLEVARQVAALIRERNAGIPLYTPTYQWVAMLRFYGVDARQMDGISRPSNFTLRPDHLADVDEAYVWNETILPDELAEGYGEPELVRSFPIVVRGEVISGLHLFRYKKLAKSSATE